MMSLIKKIKLRSIPFLLILLIIFFMPFSAFLLTWAKYALKLSNSNFFIISLWKEYILIMLSFIITFKFIKKDKFDFKLLKIDKLILSFLLVVFLYFLFSKLPLNQKLSGVRYDIEFLLFYFAVRLLNFNIKEFKIIIYTFLISGTLALIFGLMQISLLSPEFMQNFGYSGSVEEYVRVGTLSTYTAVDPSLPDVYRIQSFLPGSLQFSSYLVVLLSLMIIFIFLTKKSKKYIFILLTALAFLAVYSTHTRSAWIAVLFSLLAIATFFIKNKKVLLISILSLFLLSSIAIYVFNNNYDIQTVILHGEFREGELFGSTQAHFDSLIDSADLFIKNPLGNGVGYSGPVSRLNQNPIITENGYLQIGLELGFLGLIIFMLVITGILASLKEAYINSKDNFQKYLSIGLFSALLGVSINNIFLHTFSDTATIYPLFIFIGILISLNQKELT